MKKSIEYLVDAYDSRGGSSSSSRAAEFLAGKFLVESYLQVDDALARALWTEEPNPAVVRLLAGLEVVEPPTLVSVSEIAGRLKVRPKTVHTWRERHEDFPPPLALLAIGPVWEWVEVQSWALRTGRR